MIFNWNALSANIDRQETFRGEAIAQTRDLRFNEQLPVLVYSTKPTTENEAEGIADYVGSGPCRRSVIVDASHYVHHTEYKRISEGTRALMTECHR